MVTRKDIARYRMWSHRGQIGLEEVHILEANSIHDSFWLLNILAHGNVPEGHSHYGAVQERKIPHIDLLLKLTCLKLFLNMVPSSFTDVTTRVAWMFSWRMKTRVKPLGLSISPKSASHDWLFPDSPGISDNGSDLKITLTIRPIWGLTRSVTLYPLLAWKSTEDWLNWKVPCTKMTACKYYDSVGTE